jgi:transposase-like protein
MFSPGPACDRWFMDTHSPERATRDLVLELVRLRRYGKGRARGACPHCRRGPCHRWGAFAGRQRYRCKSCGRTFSDLTGTFLARTRRIEKWPQNLAAMECALSVRQTARKVGISSSTAFRWRHRILDARRGRVPAPWRGELVADCTPVKVRRIGSAEARVWVLGAVGRAHGRGKTEARLLAVAARTARPLAATLLPLISMLAAPGCRVRDRRGRVGAVALAGRRLGLPAGRRDRRASTSLGRLLRGIRPFLRPFRGVSLRWLQNYLEWNLMVGTGSPGRLARLARRTTGPPVAPGLRLLRLVL